MNLNMGVKPNSGSRGNMPYMERGHPDGMPRVPDNSYEERQMNQMNTMNLMNPMNPMNQMNQMKHVNQMNQMNPMNHGRHLYIFLYKTNI